jgi:PmbA protein
VSGETIRPELLTDVLGRARARGATEADGFLIEEQHFSASVRLGQVDTVKHSREQRLSLRVFAGKASAAPTCRAIRSSGSWTRRRRWPA